MPWPTRVVQSRLTFRLRGFSYPAILAIQTLPQLVYVRNIPFSYDEAAIEGLLKESSVSYASLSMPLHKFGPHKGQGKGFIFITASSEEEQKSIIDNLDGKELTVTVPPPAGAAEGEQAKERQLKLQARQGYENEPLEKETEGENGGKRFFRKFPSPRSLPRSSPGHGLPRA